jgi:hypothetical protein
MLITIDKHGIELGLIWSWKALLRRWDNWMWVQALWGIKD